MSVAATALAPGCEVWFTAEPERSRWARKIDWYLGFQMMRASCHQMRPLPEGLVAVLEREEFAVPEIQPMSEAPLMVVSSKNLPNSTTVMQPFRDIGSWAKACQRIWTSLNEPKMRVFLPDGISAESFRGAWRGSLDKIEIQS